MAKAVKSNQKPTGRFTVSQSKLKMAAIIIFSVLIGGVGTYIISNSSAMVISGSTTNCGSAHGDSAYGVPYVQNIVYKNGLKNSDSVRNLSKYLCEKGLFPSSLALKIDKSGAWTADLSKAILSFEKSDSRIAAAADGIPDAKMVCALAEYKYTGTDGVAYARYGYPIPSGFASNDCFSLLGTTMNPNSK